MRQQSNPLQHANVKSLKCQSKKFTLHKRKAGNCKFAFQFSTLSNFPQISLNNSLSSITQTPRKRKKMLWFSRENTERLRGERTEI
jgi:hypothetical protein